MKRFLIIAIGLAVLLCALFIMEAVDARKPIKPHPSLSGAGESSGAAARTDSVDVLERQPRTAQERAAAPGPAGDIVAQPGLYVLSGRVVDREGIGVPDAELLVLGKDNPFGSGVGAPDYQYDNLRGGRFATDGQGRFHGQVPTAMAVRVLAGPSSANMGIRSVPGESSLIVSPPSTDIILVVDRVPSAAVTITAKDLMAGEGLDEFKVAWLVDGFGAGSTPASGGVVKISCPVDAVAGSDVRVVLLEPSVGRTVEETIHLYPGDDRELTLGYYLGDYAQGQVFDATGAPVEGAFVYFGNLEDIYGDELFSTPDLNRVNGVRTDAHGAFRVSGVGVTLAFIHSDYLSRSDVVGSDMRVVLERRGSVRVTSPTDVPLGGARLNRHQSPEKHSEGYCVFTGVDRGAHLLTVPPADRLTLRMIANEAIEVDLTGRLQDLHLRLQSGGSPWAGHEEWVLFGTGSVATLAVFTAEMGTADLGGFFPGDYLLWSMGGHFSSISLSSPRHTIDVGCASLVVNAETDGNLVLLPYPIPEMPQRIIKRLARNIKPGNSYSYEPLRDGQYVLRDIRSARQKVISVSESTIVSFP